MCIGYMQISHHLIQGTWVGFWYLQGILEPILRGYWGMTVASCVVLEGKNIALKLWSAMPPSVAGDSKDTYLPSLVAERSLIWRWKTPHWLNRLFFLFHSVWPWPFILWICLLSTWCIYSLHFTWCPQNSLTTLDCIFVPLARLFWQGSQGLLLQKLQRTSALKGTCEAPNRTWHYTRNISSDDACLVDLTYCWEVTQEDGCGVF